MATAIITLAGFFTLRFEDTQSTETTSNTQSGPIDWQIWDEAQVQQKLASGRPVFMDFSADRCMTCKVYLANVLEHQSVVNATTDNNIAMFKADRTRRDDIIRTKLAEFGKARAPTYLIYDPDDSQNPEVLPELLTRQMMIEKMREVAR